MNNEKGYVLALYIRVSACSKSVAGCGQTDIGLVIWDILSEGLRLYFLLLAV